MLSTLTLLHILQILMPTKTNKNQPLKLPSGRNAMKTSRRTLLKNSAAAAAALSLDWRFAQAQAETVRIGVIYDHSGPFAAGGSVACAIGTQIAIDLCNERGGIAGKYKVVPVNADLQSKADVAINEVERLMNQEKIDIVDGVYSSAHAVPLAAKIEAQKKILWITTAVATAVFKDKTSNTSSVRRSTPTNMVRRSPASSRKTPRPSWASTPRR